MDSSGKALLPYDSRTAVAQDPPSSGRLPVVEDLTTAARRPKLQRGVSPEDLRALLANPTTQRTIRAVIASRLPGGGDSPLLDDLVQDANLLMLASPLGPRSTASAPGWITTIAWRAVSDHFRRRGSARKWIAPDEVDFDELPSKDEPPDDGVLLSDWLARAVAGNAKDAETLEMLLYKARLEATYDEVAAAHGLTSNALRCRVNAFKNEYEAEWRKHRAMLVLLLLLSVAAVVVAAAWVWIRSARGAEQLVPTPEVPTAPTMPTTHPSATASAQDTPFEPAAPPSATAPTHTEPPRHTPAPKPPSTPPRYNQWGKPI
jgi:DNA-directed RNA polymerase specialized sigma24 family protein